MEVTQAISYTPPPEWEPPAIEIKWENLPPLPLVQDPALLAQARRHKTHTLRAKFGADPDQPLHYSDAEIMAAELSCYKRLETLGDSVLQYHLLDFLENKYPHFTSSAFAGAKDTILTNRTLAHVSNKYGVFAAVKVKPNLSPLEARDIAADSFEAYIGALHRDLRRRGGVSELHDWFARFFDVSVFPGLESLAEFRMQRSTKKGRKNKGAKSTTLPQGRSLDGITKPAHIPPTSARDPQVPVPVLPDCFARPEGDGCGLGRNLSHRRGAGPGPGRVFASRSSSPPGRERIRTRSCSHGGNMRLTHPSGSTTLPPVSTH